MKEGEYLLYINGMSTLKIIVKDDKGCSFFFRLCNSKTG